MIEIANGAVDEELAGAVGSSGSVRFCSQKSRNNSRVCDEQRTLSTSLTASNGGGDQLASATDATATVRTFGGDYVPDFGAIFKRVLRDPKLRQPFQAFLEQQFCAENLNFYVAVERFRDMQFNNENKVGLSKSVLCGRVFCVKLSFLVTMFRLNYFFRWLFKSEHFQMVGVF
uniref:RGS domain-containing protein n=1 Tax=Angiostrongylus cantonensis TaxID=6313 RepID=A0A0K0D3X9_ANGCA